MGKADLLGSVHLSFANFREQQQVTGKAVLAGGFLVVEEKLDFAAP